MDANTFLDTLVDGMHEKEVELAVLQMYCPEICGHCCRESFCMMQQLVINQLINNSEDDQRALGSQEPSSLYSRAEGNTPRKAFVPLHRLCSLMWSKPRLERLPGVGAIQTHESRTEKGTRIWFDQGRCNSTLS